MKNFFIIGNATECTLGGWYSGLEPTVDGKLKIGSWIPPQPVLPPKKS